MTQRHSNATLIKPQACLSDRKTLPQFFFPMFWKQLAPRCNVTISRMHPGSPNPGSGPFLFFSSQQDTESTWEKLSNLQKRWIVRLKIAFSTCRLTFSSTVTVVFGDDSQVSHEGDAVTIKLLNTVVSFFGTNIVNQLTSQCFYS